MEENNLKTILFIGTNKSGSSREATRAAEKLGYFTVLFTKNEKQIEQRIQYPDIHKMILVDTNDLEQMRKEITKLQLFGLELVTIISLVDPNVHIASKLCDEFCHNRSSSKAIEIMEDKEQTRYFLKNEPYSPKFQIIQPTEKPSKYLKFPMMVKSPKSTGSKDVLLAQNKDQLSKHIATLQNKYPEEPIITEEFIVGPQYLVEVVVMNGQPHLIAVIKQDITKGKRFIITGYRVLAIVPEKLKTSLEALCQSIVHAFELETGAFHLELRLTKKGWKLIEINPRISGGAMNKMIEAAFGINLVEQTLKLLLGETANFTPTFQNFVYTKYLIVRRKGKLERVTGKFRALNSPGIYDVYIKPKKGTILIPPLSMGHRYAYIISQAKSISEAVRKANNAAREIKFHMRKI
ncbi:biotin carboxylase [Lysinibacillus sp. 2017]|nr:biotin carboxylase [Lysinibacillus sp. 2017]TGN36697.1 ATP-grasp domain-containing protein [Lysinibacillus sp. S2017]